MLQEAFDVDHTAVADGLVTAQTVPTCAICRSSFVAHITGGVRRTMEKGSDTMSGDDGDTGWANLETVRSSPGKIPSTQTSCAVIRISC